MTRRTVYEWQRSGRLRGVRAGRGWRIRSEDLEEFLQAGRSQAPAADGSRIRRKGAWRPVYPIPIENLICLSPEERMERNQAAREVLQSFMEEDEEEQRQTWEELRKALDEDRPSYRKLFP